MGFEHTASDYLFSYECAAVARFRRPHILKARLEDAVESRRKFIEENALEVKNLDV